MEEGIAPRDLGRIFPGDAPALVYLEIVLPAARSSVFGR